MSQWNPTQGVRFFSDGKEEAVKSPFLLNQKFGS